MLLKILEDFHRTIIQSTSVSVLRRSVGPDKLISLAEGCVGELGVRVNHKFSVANNYKKSS